MLHAFLAPSWQGVSQGSQDACPESSCAAMTMPENVSGVNATQELNLAPLPTPSCRASSFQLMLWVKGHFSLLLNLALWGHIQCRKGSWQAGISAYQGSYSAAEQTESQVKALAGNAFQHKFGFKKPVLVRSESVHRLYQCSTVHGSSTFLFLEIKPFGSSLTFHPGVNCCTF